MAGDRKQARYGLPCGYKQGAAAACSRSSNSKHVLVGLPPRPCLPTRIPRPAGRTLGALWRVAVDSRREESDTVTLMVMGPISALSMKYLRVR